MKADFLLLTRGASLRGSSPLPVRIHRPRRSVLQLFPEIFSRSFAALLRLLAYPWTGPLLVVRSVSSLKRLLLSHHAFRLLSLRPRRLRSSSLGLGASCKWAQI